MLRRAAFFLALAAGATCIAVAPADAATARTVGAVSHATQDTFTHRLLVSGWAYDTAASARPIVVRVYADGHYAGQARTDRDSVRLNAARHLKGQHAYVLSVTYARTAKVITVRSAGATASAPLRTVVTHLVSHVQAKAGDRIVAVAKRYVGKARYVEGGSAPKSGFDCSGYTKYVYAVAHVATLPHNAEAERRMSRMHRVSASKAVPGDLVFYLSGGYAYHVAIYAGHHKQFAAATPRDGIRYQSVWSSNVVYGHFR